MIKSNSSLHTFVTDGTTETFGDLSLSIAPVSVNSPSGITVTDKPVSYSRRKRATTVSDTVLLGTFYNPSLNPVTTPITITVGEKIYISGAKVIDSKS